MRLPGETGEADPDGRLTTDGDDGPELFSLFKRTDDVFLFLLSVCWIVLVITSGGEEFPSLPATSGWTAPPISLSPGNSDIYLKKMKLT